MAFSEVKHDRRAEMCKTKWCRTQIGTKWQNPDSFSRKTHFETLHRIIFRCGDICNIKHMTYQVFRLSQVIKSLALMFEDQKLSKKGLVYKKESALWISSLSEFSLTLSVFLFDVSSLKRCDFLSGNFVSSKLSSWHCTLL